MSYFVNGVMIKHLPDRVVVRIKEVEVCDCQWLVDK